MAATNNGQISVNPVSGALGAEISGIDLSQPLDNKTFSDIYQAFLDHLVIFFRDQDITPDQQKAFSQRFGKLHIHPLTEGMADHPEVIEIIKEPEERHNWGDLWHIDLTALERPTLGSVLYAREVPEYCGDTQWSNMYLAYETLSDGMKSLIDGLVCVHTGGADGYKSFKGMQHIDAAAMRAEHPLVRTHPDTRKKSLFLSRKAIKHFKDMTPEESAPLLGYLYEHSINPDFACRFHWRNNSIAMWDNRCTQHRVQADYFYEQRGFEPVRRRMHRVSIEGDRPV
jgi:taurine dioxygenase